MGSSSSKPTTEQKEQMIREENDRIEEMESMVSNIETLIEGNPNPTLPHLVQLFSNAVSVQKPELICFKDMVEIMKKNWNNLSKCLDALGIHIDNNDRKGIISLQRDYWGLLLKTRSVMSILVKKCQIQQRDVRILLNLINIAAQNGGELTKDEQTAHKECVKSLGEWIKINELQTLYNEWKDLCVRLQEQEMTWKEKVETFKKGSKRLAMDVLLLLTGVAVLGGVICLIIFSAMAVSAASAGAAAAPAAVAGAAAVKSVTVFGVSLLASHAIGIGISSGVLVLGGVLLGSHQMWKRTNAACKAYRNANKVTVMLGKMIKQSGKMENDMKILNDKQQEVQAEWEYLRDTESRIKMKEALCVVDEHLDEYIKQGRDVIKTVNSACKKYIK